MTFKWFMLAACVLLTAYAVIQVTPLLVVFGVVTSLAWLALILIERKHPEAFTRDEDPS